MRQRFLSLIAATGMVGLMAIAANAGGLTPLSNSSLATVSAKGITINQASSINLSTGAGNHATGIVIANASGSAVNDQVNVNVQRTANYFWLRQNNTGNSTNDIQRSNSPTYATVTGYELEYGDELEFDYSNEGYSSNKTSNSSVNLSGSAQAYAGGFVIANMASSAVNNQLNVNAQSSVRHFNLVQWNNGTATNNVSAYMQ